MCPRYEGKPTPGARGAPSRGGLPTLLGRADSAVCPAGPGRLPHGPVRQGGREGLITAAEMTAVIKAAGVFTNGTVIRGGGGPEPRHLPG
jgi:hypothetical protein